MTLNVNSNNDFLKEVIINTCEMKEMGGQAPIWKQIAYDGETGPADHAVTLNGTSQYGAVADYANLDGTNTYSIEIWGRPNKNTGPLIHRETYFDLTVLNGFPRVQVLSGAILTSSISIKVGARNYVAVSISNIGANSVVNLYVNSVLAGQTIVVGNIGANSSNVIVGQDLNTSEFLDGEVDEIVLYNIALTQAQITERWNDGIGTEDLPSGVTEATEVTAQFNFDDGTPGVSVLNNCTLGFGEDMALTGTPGLTTGLVGGDLTGDDGVFAPVFDATNKKSLYFPVHALRGMKPETDYEPTAFWAKATASAGDVVWKVEFLKVAIGEAYTTTTATTGYEVSTALSAVEDDAKTLLYTKLTDIDGSTEQFPNTITMARITRDVAHASDTYTGEAILFNLGFTYIQNAMGDKDENR